jgi:hypothetical protein
MNADMGDVLSIIGRWGKRGVRGEAEVIFSDVSSRVYLP